MNSSPHKSFAIDAEHTPANTHFSIKTYEQVGIDLCQTVEDVLCLAEEEQEAMRRSLLAQISEMQIPECDSDDEGEGEVSSYFCGRRWYA